MPWDADRDRGDQRLARRRCPRACTTGAARRGRARVTHFPVDVVHLHGVDFHAYLPPPGPPALVTLHRPLSSYHERALRPGRPRTFLHCVAPSQRRQVPAGVALIADIPNGVRVASFKVSRRKSGFALALGRLCADKGFIARSPRVVARVRRSSSPASCSRSSTTSAGSTSSCCRSSRTAAACACSGRSTSRANVGCSRPRAASSSPTACLRPRRWPRAKRSRRERRWSAFAAARSTPSSSPAAPACSSTRKRSSPTRNRARRDARSRSLSPRRRRAVLGRAHGAQLSLRLPPPRRRHRARAPRGQQHRLGQALPTSCRNASVNQLSHPEVGCRPSHRGNHSHTQAANYPEDVAEKWPRIWSRDQP